MNIEFDFESTKEDPRYKMITQDWQLLKADKYWALIHRANACNGAVAGPLDKMVPKQKNCSGCGRKCDSNVLRKLTFLVKMDLVNKAWRPGNDPSAG